MNQYFSVVIASFCSLLLLVSSKAGALFEKAHCLIASETCDSFVILGFFTPKEQKNLTLPFKNVCFELLEKSMLLLSYVIDGSIDEGVSYGSASSRGIMQYVYLALRHFNKDHTSNPWLKEHFWFFYATTLPGYQRAVGIADSIHNWFCGPESQLVFLDAFVMKNGYGNWLADRIRSAKATEKPLAQPQEQIWGTLHTEFIFYDASIKPAQPVLPSNNSLHIFSDWGVVTYGGGQQLKTGNTFLSFKSGVLHGEAVSDIVNYKLLSSFINGWKNFNPGHEHPDQNSFVFAPNGRYFVTDALYYDKLTYLNNVLMFGPAESKCNQLWQGQAGECPEWLAYAEVFPVPRGKVVAATETNGFVFIAGDAAHAYRPELGLKSEQRSLLLLHPEVLLVLNTVILNQNSSLKHASAFFNNVLHPFEPCDYAGFAGAKVLHPEGPYSLFWLQPAQAQAAKLRIRNKLNDRISNFVNITFNLNPAKPNKIAFLFVGPNVQLTGARFLHSRSLDITQLEIILDKKTYIVAFSSLTSSVKQRVKYLGFGGFATINVQNQVTRLGIEREKLNLDKQSDNDFSSVNGYVRSLISTVKEIQDGVVEEEEDIESHFWLQNTKKYILFFGFFTLFCFLILYKEKCIG